MVSKSSSSSSGSASTSAAITDQDIKMDTGVKDDARKKLAETLNMRLCG